MNMILNRNWFRTGFVLLFVAILLFFSCGKKEAPKILAKVGNEVITVDDFIFSYELQARPGAKPRTEKDVDRHLERLIENKLLAKYGHAKQYQDDPRIAPQIKAITKYILVQELYQKKVAEKVSVPEAELREGFLKSKTQLRARHLFVRDKQIADSLRNLLDKGYTFRELSRNLFRDSTLARNGGDLGYFTFGDMDEEFERAAFQMRVGEISAPIQTRWGYHIIKVEDRIESPILTENDFQSNKHRIQKVIRKRKETKLAQEFVKNYMKSKNVVVKAEAVNFLVAAAKRLEKQIDSLLPSQLPEIRDEEIKQIQNEIEAHSRDKIVEFTGGYWDIGLFFEKINETLPADRPVLTSHLDIAEKLALMVRNEFLYEEAKKLNLADDPRVKPKLKQETNKQIARLVRADLINSVQLTESDYQNYFNNNTRKYISSPKYKLREIVVETYELALKYKTLLRSGENFARLANQVSLRKESAQKGGDIGYINQRDFPKIAELVSGLKVGEISEPLLMHGQYRIFQLLDRRDGRQFSYEEIKNVVKKDLQSLRNRQIINETINQLKKEHEVRVNQNVLSSLKSEKISKRVEMINIRN